MTKLKIGALPDERPVKVSIELPASVHRDLVAYAKALANDSGQAISDPGKLPAASSVAIRQSTVFPRPCVRLPTLLVAAA